MNCRVIEVEGETFASDVDDESKDEQEDVISADLLPHEYDPEHDDVEEEDDDADEDEYPTDIDYVIGFLRDMAESQQYFRPEMN